MELSLPAGNLECALAAFNGGADSVYLGLKEFSARKTAENFSFDDLRRLKEYSDSHNKKFYIALNTIVSENELENVYKLLKKIEYVNPNGIIVQDFGNVNIIQKHFPSLELHASTQMAVRTTDDVNVLKALGFKRVVLSRELSLSEIREIRQNTKDIELKVFIHGALCYSISGRCYASEHILGNRSANRGDCVGVCRWKWTNERCEKAHFFSLSDLECDKKTIDELKDINIDALKVEGRLKNDVYTFSTARYYRALIDGSENTNDLKEEAECAFSRKTSTGYFYKNEDNFKKNLECMDYVGHRGTECGIFINKSDVRLTSPIYKHDGLMFIDKNGSEHKFTLKGNRIKYSDNEIIRNIAFGNDAFNGCVLYKIKGASSTLKSINKNSIELYLKKKNEDFIIENDYLQIGDVKLPFSVQKALTKQNLLQNIKEVFKTKEGLVCINDIKLYNNCYINDISDIYIPLSILKKIKNEYYKSENEKLLKYFDEPFEAPVITLVKNTPTQQQELDYKTLDSTNYKRINTLGDLKEYIDKTATKNALIMPEMNSANSECATFYKKLCSPFECVVTAIDEKALKNDAPRSIVRLKNYKTPIFTSLAPLPKPGIYKTEILGKKVSVEVAHKNGITYTYLL